MEYEANVSQGEILADLINILSSTTPYITAFNHFAKDFALLCEDDKHALLAIKDILEQCLVEDSSAADIVIPYLIEQIAISKPEESASVIVTDLQTYRNCLIVMWFSSWE
jgi:hypothetical protein